MKKILVIASTMLFGFIGAHAAGTAAGTSVTNSATLNYTVGTVAQTAIVSNTDTFVVDNKIDLTVVHQDAAIVEVTPGATAQVLTYTVTNTGNKVQDYSLTQTANDGNPFGATDNFDATGVSIFVDSNGNGVYDAGTDTATFIDELAPDAAVKVFIVADIPSGQADGDVAEYTLTAQVAQGGTASTQGADILTDDSGTADTAAGEEIVFADGDGAGATEGANDGKHADNNAFKVVTATLTSVKSSCVVSDPVNAGTNPKRIPGAVVRYSIEVANSGTADATSVSISDTLAAEFGTSAAGLEVRTAACAGIDAGTNACAAKTGTVEPVGGTTGAGTSSVTLDYATVAAGTTECGYIDVTIQ